MSLLNILLLTNMYPFAPNNKIHLLNKCYMSYFTEFINKCDVPSFMCNNFLVGLHVVQLTTPPLVAPPEMVALRVTSHAPRRVAYMSCTPPCALLCVPSQQARIWPYIMETKTNEASQRRTWVSFGSRNVTKMVMVHTRVPTVTCFNRPVSISSWT